MSTPACPFQPTQRLRHKSEFDLVYRESRRSADAMFAILARESGFAHARLGLSVAARVIGTAVARNRIKRVVRESFRLHQDDLPHVDIVVNARGAAKTATNAELRRSLEQHWQSVKKKCARS